MRIVLDTNIFISGIFWEGNFSSKIIDLWKNKKLDLVSSIPLVEELVKTLSTFKIQMDKRMIKHWENMIIKNAIMVIPSKNFNIIEEDPDDNKILECAIEGNSDYIISQDKHLLKLKEFKGIKIITPIEFLTIIK
jgi:hypothetical protein|tara:strand:+ start:483 stop:887 length:405 start_codon:yes stop_codon:yes gene_type:complete